LGYYKGFTKDLGWSTTQLVQELNDFAKYGLLYEQGHANAAPPLLARTVGKMGLKVSVAL
jgi:formylmethanofuran dehydrogenase subunit B